MYIILDPLLTVIGYALEMYQYVMIAWIIFSWLLYFGVINTYNHAVRTIGDVLNRLTEPALKPIRRYMPDFGPVDLSPIVLWLIIIFLMKVVFLLKLRLAGL